MSLRTSPFARAVSRTFANIRNMREEARTARLISELPASIRKDIGWPDGYSMRPSRWTQ